MMYDNRGWSRGHFDDHISAVNCMREFQLHSSGRSKCLSFRALSSLLEVFQMSYEARHKPGPLRVICM